VSRCACSRGLDQLWSDGGWIDTNMTLGKDGMFDLIRRGLVVNSLIIIVRDQLDVGDSLILSIELWCFVCTFQWRFYIGAGGTIALPVFGFALSVWHGAIFTVLDEHSSLSSLNRWSLRLF